jgi:anion-transporting  ArsA/GET3 family ATPase
VRFHAEQRVVFITGKGGVGKSTIAAALARAEADRVGRAVLVEFDGADAAARALGEPHDGVRVERVDYFDALASTVGAMLASKVLGKVVVRQRTMRRVMQAVPAVRELVALDRVRTLAEQSAGARLFVDLPATGHAVDWLRVPAAAERFLVAGPAAKVCRKIREQILADDKSALCVVSTAEPVVAAETRELCFRLEHELGRAPALVVVNRAPRCPDPSELTAASELASSDPSWAEIAAALKNDAELGVDAKLALTALHGLSAAKLVEVPELFRDPSCREIVQHLERSQ